MPSVRTSCRRRDENAKTKTKNKNKTATTNPHMGDGRVAVVGPSSARTQHRGGLPAAGDFSKPTELTHSGAPSCFWCGFQFDRRARASNSKYTNVLIINPKEIRFEGALRGRDGGWGFTEAGALSHSAPASFFVMHTTLITPFLAYPHTKEITEAQTTRRSGLQQRAPAAADAAP